MVIVNSELRAIITIRKDYDCDRDPARRTKNVPFSVKRLTRKNGKNAGTASTEVHDRSHPIKLTIAKM